MAHLCGQFGRFDECLAGHTAVVEAVATHFVGLDQGYLGLDRRCDVGRHQTACATANYHQVAVKGLGFGMVPLGVHLAGLNNIHDFFGNQREQAQQHKGADQAG